MKPPLSIFVLWHHGFAEGEQLANTIFTNFKRNVTDPLSRGVNIPVFFRSHDTILLEIPEADYEQVVVIAIVDPKFVNDDRYRGYLKKIVARKNPNVLVLPIATFKSAFKVGISERNFLRLYEKVNKKDSLIGSLAHEITKHLLELPSKRKRGSPPPLMLFISHAKIDGLEVAEKIKLFVEKETGLETFFDANKISTGSEFSDEIAIHIEKAVIIAVHTDSYSCREWCRREILLAKENNRPIVILNSLKDGESRSFPYMANVLTVHYLPMKESVWPQMMAAVLKETLRLKYQEKLIEYLAHSRGNLNIDECIVSAYPPELITVLKLKSEKTKRFIYPDPALGAEELQVLARLDPSIEYVTASEL